MTASPKKLAPPPADSTPHKLIEAAIELFGKDGFAATSTREIATKASVNVASIAYHFGGKDGLRRACAHEFARRMSAVLASVPDTNAPSAEAAEKTLCAIITQASAFILASPEARNMIFFIIREISENNEVLDIVYENMINTAHRRFCGLVGAATGQEPESARVKLSTFSFIGQMLYFRIGAPVVARRMAWREIGPQEASQITEVLLDNLHSMLGALRKV